MAKKSTRKKPHVDWALICGLGGPMSLARRLNALPRQSEKIGDFDVQRVQNWKYRGIPARVRLEFQQVFKPRRKAA